MRNRKHDDLYMENDDNVFPIARARKLAREKRRLRARLRRDFDDWDDAPNEDLKDFPED